MTASRFTYDRSLQRDTAAVLADMRAQCWCDPQLQILDQLIDALIDQYSIEPSFNAEHFAKRARANTGRAHPYQPRRQPPWLTTTSPSSAT